MRISEDDTPRGAKEESMFALVTLLVTGLLNVLAQAPPPGEPPPAPPPAATAQPPLEDGVCLDSLRAVPRVLQPPISRAMQIVRIDQVVSTATMMPGEIIGFLYTTQDGSTWLGQRTAQYQSAADATAINQVLSATHIPGQNVAAFPPTSEYGVPTKHREIFRVSIPSDAFGPLRIALEPCVAWPSSRPLPDPSL
jgi:hypothetical protein